MVIFYQQFA